MGVSLNGGTPKHLKMMIIFSRKTHGFVGETHHFRKPPCRERIGKTLGMRVFSPLLSDATFEISKSLNLGRHTVDGRNSAPVDMVNILLFIMSIPD